MFLFKPYFGAHNNEQDQDSKFQTSRDRQALKPNTKVKHEYKQTIGAIQLRTMWLKMMNKSLMIILSLVSSLD